MSEENQEEQELMGVGPKSMLLRDGHFWQRREDGVVVPVRTSPGRWQEAIEAAEGPTPRDEITKSDSAPLLELLESDAPMSNWDRRMLADLLRRHNPLTKPGRKKSTPIYRLPSEEKNFILAMAHYSMLRGKLKDGTRTAPDDVAAEVAPIYGLTVEKLREAISTGRRSATRTGRQTGKRAKKKP